MSPLFCFLVDTSISAKSLHIHLLSSERQMPRQRFVTEVKSAAKLQHVSCGMSYDHYFRHYFDLTVEQELGSGCVDSHPLPYLLLYYSFKKEFINNISITQMSI